ncbi:hypothetical protein GOBAR_DD15088 [Gossypium barbadense]|nr:hypothetical protein GOBAR_DD15088 [Gossypium barbadense]
MVIPAANDSTCRCFGYMVSKKKYVYTIDDDCFALPNRREALIISSWPQTSLPRSTDLTRAIRNARAEYSVEPAKRITASIVGSEEVIQYISIVSESQKRLPTEDKSGAGIRIHDNNE